MMRGQTKTIGTMGLVLALCGCSALIDTDPAKLSGAQGSGTCTPACDDGIPCTRDECGPDNRCVFKPDHDACDDGIGCTIDECDPKRGCQFEASDELCQYCAPGGTCDVKNRGCVGFTSQRDCNDDDPCTADACVVAEMMCVSKPVDADEDGHPASQVRNTACGGTDCDDTRAGVYPGALEVCNGRDDDCDGRADEDCMASPDTCDTAVTVTLTNGAAMLEGSFNQLEANFDVPCGSEDAPDAVYRIELDGAGPVDVLLESANSQAEVVLAGSSSCGPSGFRNACAEPLSTGPTRLLFHRYDESELFVLIDAKDRNEDGNYAVKVRVTEAATDLCLPTALDFSGCGTLIGVMPQQQGELVASCQGGVFARAQSEAIVRFDGLSDAVSIRVASEEFSPSLSARESCGPFSSDFACDQEQGGEARIDIEPGRSSVYVVVDGASPRQSYTLTCEF